MTYLTGSCTIFKIIEDGDIAAVFSLLSNSFQDTQQASLENYISTSVMLQYNSVFIDMVTIIIILCLRL